MFDFLKKKEVQLDTVNAPDDVITAPLNGRLIDVSTVPDEMFAQKMLGDSIAFAPKDDSALICSPVNGTVAAVFPTGHAFGIRTKQGAELLIHIGIDTVKANGDGFTSAGKKEGDEVKAGDPIVTVNVRKLRKKYDMSVMLIVTDANGKTIQFADPQPVKRGQEVGKIQ